MATLFMYLYLLTFPSLSLGECALLEDNIVFDNSLLSSKLPLRLSTKYFTYA